ARLAGDMSPVSLERVVGHEIYRTLGCWLRRFLRRFAEDPVEADLAIAYERCRALHKQHGRTYYLATRLLPAWKRRHVHALYGFTRYADEIVDRTEELPPEQRAERLTEWSDRFVAGLRGETVD